jgi:uncharacterized membrane protein YphA (DoxX/SURF4 family)
MNNNIVSRIGAAIYGLVMIVFGINHLKMGSGMAAYVPAYFPAHTFFVYLTGAGLLLAGIAIILNVKSRLAGYLLAAMLLIIALAIHLPPVINGTDDGSHFANLLKDLALTGAALFIGGKGK